MINSCMLKVFTNQPTVNTLTCITNEMMQQRLFISNIATTSVEKHVTIGELNHSQPAVIRTQVQSIGFVYVYEAAIFFIML